MANEARLNISMSIRKVSSGGVVQLRHDVREAFVATVTGTKGPTPGSIAVDLDGTDIVFSELITPGLCRLTNQDATNFVEVGIRDPATGLFYPVIELLPGETFVVRLSRNLQEDYTNTGTGTSGPINYLHAKANVAAVNLLVEAFEQ